jgi:ABC-2 type transport system permease protein
MHKLLIQLKREFWECRSSFVKTPMVTAGILMGLLLLGVVPWHSKISGVMQQHKEANPLEFKMGSQVFNELGQQQSITTEAGYLVHGLATVYTVFAIILLLVLMFYFVDTLYSDRRDQSILFWKSMPVSEHSTILTKLAAGIAGAPLFYAVAALATGALFLAVFLFYAGFLWNIPVPGMGATVLAFFKSSLGLVLGWWLLVLWYLPLFCWLLISSAFARKSPFLLALGAPLAVAVLEKWVLGSHNIFSIIKNQIVAGFYNFQVLLHGPGAVFEQLGSTLASFQLWIGLLLSAALLAGCTWLRKNRWEI